MKGRRAHTAELNDAAPAFLAEALAASPGNPFPFSYWFVARRWVAIRDEAGFPGVRIHDLRHSFVSNQLAAGTPPTSCATRSTLTTPTRRAAPQLSGSKSPSAREGRTHRRHGYV